MKIIIVGCGKIGASIANELNTDENNIVVFITIKSETILFKRKILNI